MDFIDKKNRTEQIVFFFFINSVDLSFIPSIIMFCMNFRVEIKFLVLFHFELRVMIKSTICLPVIAL